VFVLFRRKHYITSQALGEHKRGKVHKRRVKDTDEVPYSIEESERAGGLGTYEAPAAKRQKKELSIIAEDAEIKDVSD
jgi:bud site selection protein 20